MENIKLMSSYDNELWKSFYTPNDPLTKRYKEIIDEYEGLPATFYILKDTPDSYGLANLEIKSKYIKKIKTTPLLSKLINGNYKTEKSKSDDKIVKDTNFFVNNLPSFNKYKDTDDLTYIINNHRLLIIEILEYYAKTPSTSLRTIEGRIVGLMRIFYIAYGTKKYDLYQKYSIIVYELNNQFKLDKNKQQFSEREEKANVEFEIILAKQKQLKEQYDALKNKLTNQAYELNQDLVIVSLYGR